MPNNLFKPTDVGMPGYATGLVGGFLPILDACLVDGLAAFPVASMTRSGGTVTVELEGYVNSAPTQMKPILNFEGVNGSTTFTDDTGTVTFTANGAAQISTAQAKWGSASGVFNGTNAYISATASAGGPFDFLLGDFTVEYWAYQTTLPATNAHMGVWNSGNTVWLFYSTATDFRFYQNSTWVLSCAPIPLNQWVHIAVTRQGGVFRMFFNGVLVSMYAGALTTSFTACNGSPFVAGRLNSSGADYYTGYFDGLRITKGVCLYVDSFTPPAGPTSFHIAPDPSLVNGNYVTFAGAGQAEYNGAQGPITVINSHQFTFPITTTPASPATGTITRRKSALGWTRVFTGPNKAVYRSPNIASNRFYLRVDDSTINTMTMRGYESMSDVDTGVNPFPTPSQHATGLYTRKSNTADSTPRTFTVWGDDKTVWWCCFAGLSSYDNYMHGFGHFISFRPGDQYNTFVAGERLSSAGNTNGNIDYFMGQPTYMGGAGWVLGNTSTSQTGLFLARSYTQTGLPQATQTLVPWSSNSNNGGNGAPFGVSIYSGAVLTSPNATDLALYFTPIFIADGVSNVTHTIRGRFPGIYAALMNFSPAQYDVTPGVVLWDGSLRQLTHVQMGALQGAGFISTDAQGPWL